MWFLFRQMLGEKRLRAPIRLFGGTAVRGNRLFSCSRVVVVVLGTGVNGLLQRAARRTRTLANSSRRFGETSLSSAAIKHPYRIRDTRPARLGNPLQTYGFRCQGRGRWAWPGRSCLRSTSLARSCGLRLHRAGPASSVARRRHRAGGPGSCPFGILQGSRAGRSYRQARRADPAQRAQTRSRSAGDFGGHAEARQGDAQ